MVFSGLVTRPPGDVERVQRLLATGMPVAEAARQAGIPRSTVREWLKAGPEALLARREAAQKASLCDPCFWIDKAPKDAYAYLLGLYLGDGCISLSHRGVFRLRICLDARYPLIIEACVAAMAAVLPNVVGRTQAPGMMVVGASSKHWPCLFPQHGSGPKHLREIRLEPWQRELARELYPRQFLQGLMHSDGCVVLNRIKRIKGPGPIQLYSYRRYQFSNRSHDIRALFQEACRIIGVESRMSNAWTVSVSRRPDVQILDEFIGPKC